MVRERDVKEDLISLYSDLTGREVTAISLLPGAGSDRKYYRIYSDEETVIGVYGIDVKENRAFCRLAKFFKSCGAYVPAILGINDLGDLYIQEDLGSNQLFDMLHTPEGDQLIRECMRNLAFLQTLPREQWESLCFNRPFSRRQVMWDLNYFKYEYLKPAGISFDEEALENDFERLAETLTAVNDRLIGFMYRDCQSRNVMVKNNKPYWIDFQGGRPGPGVYDAISFLWQAKAKFSSDFRQSMLETYANEFGRLRGVSSELILVTAPKFILFRTLQVLGAYGFRGLVEHKAHFVESIPGALTNLSEILSSGVLSDYAELERVCRELIEDKRFIPTPDDGKLRVEVFSFSYKKGYPANYTSNGGGFMFDCRGLHNPGRYDEYKPLTGLDKPVSDFLEKRGEIQPYLEASWQMVDQAVSTYLRRGFTSLQIGYGCTGGRHRSVYSADSTAKHLAEKFPDAIIIVNHREQQIKYQL